jgi:TonB family protein
MKAKLLSLIATTLLLSASVQGQTLKRSESLTWKLYTIGGEDFSVALPVLPARHTRYEYIDEIQKHRRTYSLGAYADGVAYVVYIFENPKRQSLDAFIEAQGADKPNFTELNVNVNGFPGKQISGVDSIFQFFATKDRLYEFLALGASLDDTRMTTFFSSVLLHKKKDSIEVDEGPGLPYQPAEEVQPAGVDGTTKLFTGKEVDKKIRLAMKPEPMYTEIARQNQLTGTVVLKCVFASNGSVTNIRTVSGLPYGLTERAIDAAKKIKFIPAVKDGKYVSMWMQLEYNFNLY